MNSREFAELVHQHQAALVLYARQWCALPEDAVQEAMIDLAGISEFPVSPVAWLYTATRRKAQNLARSESRRKRYQQQAASEKSTWFEAAAEEGSGLGDAASLQNSLEQLGEVDRQLVVARTWGELTFEQLAELMNCSVGTAHRRYVDALRKLKQILDSTAAPGQVVDCESAEAKPSRPVRSTQRLISGELG